MEEEPFVPINRFDAMRFFGILAAHWRSGVADHVEAIKIDGDRILIDLKQSTAYQLPDIFIPLKKTEGDKALSKQAEAIVKQLSAFAREGKVPEGLVDNLYQCIDRTDRSLMFRSMSLKQKLNHWLSKLPPPPAEK